ncbi:alpha/beta hydrolase [Luteipulveratus flavus]|uniref:Alpha/beta hydrolase n=1 Tax=Luteipulveratus flavus TaxID=3031728 RepID=A0ABT6C8Y7_9MICO|nr:alpha/beta hydrolase [Luteipulveratus sp. YIM 133296]MDF8264762.1 alpha/beta hydrolase [Luteipulveratus sp. YIM 133296]
MSSTTSRRPGYGRMAAVGLLGLATVLAGCDRDASVEGAPPSATGTTGGASTSAPANAAPSPSLARFYTQKLKWEDCQDGAKCAGLTVPIDYAKPAAGTVQVAVLKQEATGDKKGSLVVNPGGPGGSGVDYAASADFVVSGKVRKAYDVVGFDPRGVQRSAPITCLDDQQLDSYLGADPSPDDQAEQAQTMKNAKGFGDACKTKAGPLLGHVSTVEAAKDMDVLRAALGETRLDYLGKSYGTFLGSTYADQFPTRVGKFVLDGVVAPDLTNTEMNRGQAEGFERATAAYVKDCVAGGNCPLGSSQEAGQQKIRDFLKQVDAKPIPVSGDANVSKLTEGWASMGIAAAMYDQGSWGVLTSALRSAFGGDGTALMKLANTYAERDSGGSYSGNIMQAINAVNCLDRDSSSDPAAYAKDQASFVKTAPTWGPMLAWGTAICGEWPVKATGAPKKVTAAGSDPILVLGTTRDPATPYEWSQRLASMLQNGRLITYDGDGHTAYRRSNSCVDNAVDNYLLDGKDPGKSLKC